MNAAQQQPCSQHPTLRAGQGPPEDDEYEYSEYSVEEYQDPEAPWDGDGENGGWPRGTQGGAVVTPADLSLTPSPSLTAATPADLMTPIGPRPLLASAGRGLLHCLHPALVPSGRGRWHRGLSPLCLWWLWRECQSFWDP